MGDEYEDEPSSFVTRTLQIPCYRSSLLFGIGGGIISGLGFFLFTSRAKRATHVGLGTYIGTTLASWFYCRHQMAKKEIEQREFKQALQQKLLQEGVMPSNEKPVTVKLEDA